MLTVFFLILFLLLASAGYAAWRGAPWVPTWKRDLERIKKLAQLKEGDRFVELGCGTGRVCRYLAKHSSAKTFGVELSFLQWATAHILSWRAINYFSVILRSHDACERRNDEGFRGLRDSSLAALAQNDRNGGIGRNDEPTFFLADAFHHDLSSYSVVYMFLMPETYKKMRDKLMRELAPGARVITYVWPIPDWTPSSVDHVDGSLDLYVYVKK
jgi:SAM-dependent methyltransferase